MSRYFLIPYTVVIVRLLSPISVSSRLPFKFLRFNVPRGNFGIGPYKIHNSLFHVKSSRVAHVVIIALPTLYQDTD